MPSPTDRIKIIQVGAGAMGRLWLDVLAGSADVELVGLVDIDLSAAQLSAAGAGLPNVALARSLPELLDLVAADAVLNVTVPEAHAEVSITALLHGLAVLCEKPLADTLAAALSMIAAAEVGGRLLMVSQSRRYWRNLDALRGQIAQLGRLGLVQCSFFKAPHFGGFREEMAYPLLTDMAIHQFDLARDLIGSEPRPSTASPSTRAGAGTPATRPPTLLSTSRTALGSCLPAAGAVLVWKRPGMAAGESARPAAQRCGTVTMHR